MFKFLTIIVFKTKNRKRVDKSRFIYGVKENGVYFLRILGVLHGLFGLVANLYGEPNTLKYRRLCGRCGKPLKIFQLNICRRCKKFVKTSSTSITNN